MKHLGWAFVTKTLQQSSEGIPIFRNTFDLIDRLHSELIYCMYYGFKMTNNSQVSFSVFKLGLMENVRSRRLLWVTKGT